MFSKSENEKILKTTYHISNIKARQSNESFKREVLQQLSNHLQYHHILFWEVAGDDLVETPVTFNIEKNVLSDYLTTYQYHDPLHPKNMQSHPSIQLMHKKENANNCYSQTYYQDHFLKANCYEDEMVMYLGMEDNYMGVMGFLRNRNEEKFSQKDILTLAYLKKTIENIYLLHKSVQTDLDIYVTHREEEILKCIYGGLINSEIAQHLFVSENTVKKHLQNLYRKFNVTNRTQLLVKYLKR